MKKTSIGRPPFLRNVVYLPPEQCLEHPFSTPLFSKSFEVGFSQNVTIFAGENGVGKSTLLEAIAHHCGFAQAGGSKSHNLEKNSDILSRFIRLSWLPKVTEGFFFRAESFFLFASQIDQLAREGGRQAYKAYGGKSLHAQSHGEAFLSLFANRLDRRGIYIFDEPEAALSPARQLSLLALIGQMDRRNDCQLIIATHSPIIMSYPRASLVLIDDDGNINAVSAKETPHWKLYARIINEAPGFMTEIYED